VEPDDLSREVERLAGREALPGDGALDTNNPLHVDRASAALLKRFFTDNEPEAFEALVAVAYPLLSRAARDVTREVGLAVPPDSLVGEHMAHLFIDVAPDARTRAGGAHFLAAAARAMGVDAQQKVTAFAQSPLAVLAALEGAAADPVDAPALLRLASASAAGNVAQTAGLAGLSPADTPRLPGTPRGGSASRLAQALLSTAFHRLDRLQRRALLAREVDDLPLPDVAVAVGVGQNQVASTLVEARLRLAAELSTLLDTFRHPGGQGGGGGKKRRRP
jgi:DNA-directed RNA polymerase specialized sigma24 family protein